MSQKRVISFGKIVTFLQLRSRENTSFTILVVSFLRLIIFCVGCFFLALWAKIRIFCLEIQFEDFLLLSRPRMTVFKIITYNFRFLNLTGSGILYLKSSLKFSMIPPIIRMKSFSNFYV